LNILAYVNLKSGTRFADLSETFTGYFLASDGRTMPTYDLRARRQSQSYLSIRDQRRPLSSGRNLVRSSF
jgi:hypothetical protein